MFSIADLERNVLAFLWKTFSDVEKTACLVSKRSILWKNSFSKRKNILFFIKDLEWNFIGFLPRNIWWVCEKRSLRIHSNILMNIVFFDNFQFFKHFWTLTEEHLFSSQNFSDWVETIGFYVLRLDWNFLTIFFPKNIKTFFNNFGHWVNNSRLFVKIFIGELLKTTFYVSIRTLRRLIFSGKKFCFRSISDIEHFFLTLCWINIDEVVKTASYVFIVAIWRKKFFDEKTSKFQSFWDLEKIPVRVCRKLLGRFVTISFYVTMGTFLRKKLFFRKLFLIF